MAHEQRRAQRPGVVARDDRDRVGALLERLAQLLGARVLEPHDVRSRRLERRARLVGEVAGAQQEDAPSRHASRTYPLRAAIIPRAARAARAARPPACPRSEQRPEPLPYLREPPWALDLALEVELNGAVVARSNARHLYWTPAQMIAHLTANGASLRTGDLLGSGTISGPERGQRGSLIELGWNGAEPLELPGGGRATFLEDGDTVVLRGAALGEVAGRILPAAGIAASARAPGLGGR